ncbi:hypothetical protein B0H16DRAFT_1741222 [Mycena metata]|uniref:CxC2-like cysteine cluster KDZ transposase-associated domain-containing protein n=1 Tax=Mycena metata TaxID=1033252 RepID=A0AAD7HAT1_9AGAR|nr:hypothetical protein B0H16DRAFT_1741222 [Mycena metata]
MGRRPASSFDIEVGGDWEEETAVVADHGVYFSADGLRRQEELLNVAHKKRRVQPTELEDSYAQWIPVPDDGYDIADGRDSESNPMNAVDATPTTNKRKLYASSVDPMSLWRPMKSRFSDEILRHHGLGNDYHDPKCARCQIAYTAAGPTAVRIFKCEDCGEFLQCSACCVSHHATSPLHVEWTGSFWATISLAALGLVYQLGHGGFPCRFPGDRTYKMTVIEAPTIHQIHMRYCACSRSDSADKVDQLLRNAWYPASLTDPATCATFKTLSTFRLYNVVGNMNVHDFVRAMERGTDVTASTGMTWLPDRYKPFQRMARQWAFLSRLQRTGCTHKVGGVDTTTTGEAGVNCWPCPQDKRNLPANWRDVEPRFRFLYTLLLAVDANFRLKNRMRPNEIDDPPLGPGWSYWVEPKRYHHHLKKYVGEKDMSTCIAFAALLQKDTRITTGLRSSGVGGCVCARHECVRPNGIGDLQKGERYANMDYIVLSALLGFSLMLLTISYDIACQWKKKFPARHDKMPKALRLPLDQIEVQCALPVWHVGSHNEDCQKENSLSFKTGVGKSDGEGVERVWSVLNPAANHTKDSGRGQRVDSLEDKIDSHNFSKNIGQGDALQRKLLVAIAERDRQVEAFKEISNTIERPVRNEWKKKIVAWHEDPTKENPYTLQRKDCPTEAEVRLEGTTATAFLIAGLQIEEAQRRILGELGGTALMTADREGKLHDWRHALLIKIRKFRDLQKIYMPGAAAILAAAEAARDPDAPPPKAEKIKLWMPSQMQPDPNDALRGCVKGLLSMEAKLRVAQCNNALIQSTKARTLIGQIGERMEACALKYRHARISLIQLSGEGGTVQFRELRAQDIQLDGDAGESDAAARKKLAMISAGRGARAPRNAPGESRRVMSWIWTAPGALDNEEERLHDSIRVEWARARARKIRWEEEVMTLREEMRRVLRYLEWQADWWREHTAVRVDVESVEIGAGLRAYALKQADLHSRLGAFFERKWNMPAADAARRLVTLEAAGLDEDANLEEFFHA